MHVICTGRLGSTNTVISTFPVTEPQTTRTENTQLYKIAPLTWTGRGGGGEGALLQRKTDATFLTPNGGQENIWSWGQINYLPVTCPLSIPKACLDQLLRP